jgi:hypothetical protein
VSVALVVHAYGVSVALVNVLVGDIFCFDEAARWGLVSAMMCVSWLA